MKINMLISTFLGPSLRHFLRPWLCLLKPWLMVLNVDVVKYKRYTNIFIVVFLASHYFHLHENEMNPINPKCKNVPFTKKHQHTLASLLSWPFALSTPLSNFFLLKASAHPPGWSAEARHPGAQFPHLWHRWSGRQSNTPYRTGPAGSSSDAQSATASITVPGPEPHKCTSSVLHTPPLCIFSAVQCPSLLAAEHPVNSKVGIFHPRPNSQATGTFFLLPRTSLHITLMWPCIHVTPTLLQQLPKHPHDTASAYSPGFPLVCAYWSQPITTSHTCHLCT